jgi:SP family general alpha glucoside:H+ symporter-like MFS transporter
MSSNEKQDDLHLDAAHIDVPEAEVLGNKDLISDAIDGENQEHDMGVWEAVKTHPWACLWAFTMCFTIVSLLFIIEPLSA